MIYFKKKEGPSLGEGRARARGTRAVSELSCFSRSPSCRVPSFARVYPPSTRLALGCVRDGGVGVLGSVGELVGEPDGSETERRERRLLPLIPAVPRDLRAPLVFLQATLGPTAASAHRAPPRTNETQYNARGSRFLAIVDARLAVPHDAAVGVERVHRAPAPHTARDSRFANRLATTVRFPVPDLVDGELKTHSSTGLVAFQNRLDRHSTRRLDHSKTNENSKSLPSCRAPGSAWEPCAGCPCSTQARARPTPKPVVRIQARVSLFT